MCVCGGGVYFPKINQEILAFYDDQAMDGLSGHHTNPNKSHQFFRTWVKLQPTNVTSLPHVP